ncbi:TadE family type IV pilus minor pilin [Ruania rhizosphaerae]|uniref:TadE family type IV pilus minor pilin n=1 Tax=Ruania rhizosphaerae TaxID=1840413 RepID=UPI001358DF98|nr:TadE family type IV pilus minor pilin [Ruania rhizosphaerae]
MTGVRAPHDRGSVTAELAILLPAVVLMLVAVLTAAAAGVAQVRCADAARAGARAAALGESTGQVVAVAEHVAGADVEVGVSRDGEWVTVGVRTGLPLGPLGRLIEVSADASTPVEPGWAEGAP